MDGAERIAAERQRQIDAEGWTAEHDDEHEDEGLAYVAAWLAAPAAAKQYIDFSRDRDAPDSYWVLRIDGRKMPRWNVLRKRQSRVEALMKAGALIAAEIDRLERAQAASAASPEENDAR